MKIIYIKSIDSTQKHLKELVKNYSVELPHAIVADEQTDGLGSRDNTWQGYDGNLFLSFAIKLKDLPQDLKLESASIYFSCILKNTLELLGSSIWLKWPNDFYIEDKKIGGMITNVIEDYIVCGIGLNLKKAPHNFTILDIKIQKNTLVKLFLQNIEKNFSWKQIFSKYKINFYKNQKYYTHNNNLKISLENAELQDDGSIIVNNERIFSLR
ncbi:MAG: biotin--[acetyl-CoA-carboxylase] ligase [Sulfurimonas sp.]|nr:biotin--[acetyl-CoA-carboxylase] ligase [Sulfurimonas sp.]